MSAFNTLCSSIRDRNWGGTSSNVACEPYISGYSFVKWYLPETLNTFLAANVLTNTSTTNNTNNNTNNNTTANNSTFNENNDRTNTANSAVVAAQHLESACTGVTPPGGTLNKAEFQGLGGTKWSVPTNIDYGNSISLKYVEFSGLPILRIHRAWVNMIRDNKTGLTALHGGVGGIYNKNSYAANLVYWTTKPDGHTIEYYAAYSGVFPTKDPQDSFNGDITSIDKLELEIDYNVDFIWHEPWVYDMCVKLSNSTPYGQTTHWAGNNLHSVSTGYRKHQGHDGSWGDSTTSSNSQSSSSNAQK